MKTTGLFLAGVGFSVLVLMLFVAVAGMLGFWKWIDPYLNQFMLAIWAPITLTSFITAAAGIFLAAAGFAREETKKKEEDGHAS